jgi:hypothetical protein
MDPDNLVRPVNDHALTTVQRWVMSALVVFTIFHLSGGIALAANTVREDATGARIGLSVISGIFGVGGIATGFLIHAHKPYARPYVWWLPLGLLPALVGLWFALR